MSREENRRKMPIVAAFVDDFKAIFGEDCKVTFAAENGIEIGKRDEEYGMNVGEMGIPITKTKARK